MARPPWAQFTNTGAARTCSDSLGTCSQDTAIGLLCPEAAAPGFPPPFPGPHLLDALHQRVLVEGHSLCTLVQVVLVAQAQLQHLLRVQLLQLGVGRGRLPTEESYKAKEGPELI